MSIINNAKNTTPGRVNPIIIPDYLYAAPAGKEAKIINAGSIDANDNEAHKNYSDLKKMYFKWNHGILQSKRYYKKLTGRYLVKIREKEILTDDDYYLVIPGITEDGKTSFNLYIDNWLQIKGRVDSESLSKIVDIDRNVLAKWLRTKKLISVKGKISDHRLVSDQNGEVIILYLQDIILKESRNPDDAGKDSK